MTGQGHPDTGGAISPGHEPSDVSPRRVVYAAIGLLASIVLSGALLAAMFAAFGDLRPRHAVSPLEARTIVPPEPRLEAAPGQRRAEVEAAALARISGYGWIDRGTGIARIPIEEAMRILARRGWPDEAGTAAPAGGARE